MLAKSIIAGTVLSLMAGGVVYFGTDIDASAVKDKVAEKTAAVKAEISDKVMTGGEEKAPQDEKTAKVKTETSVDTPSVKTASGKTIEAKKATISYSSQSGERKTKTVEAASAEKPQKKWLDQYLKSETKEEKAPEKEVQSDSDTGRFVIEEDVETLTEEQIETAEAEGFEERALETENIWVEEGASETGGKKTTRKMLHDILKKDRAVFVGEDAEGEKKVEVKVIANEEGETTIETETIDMGDGKTMKIVKKTVKSESHDDDGKKMRIKVVSGDGSLEEALGDMDVEDIRVIRMTDKSASGKLMIKTKRKDISSTVKVVMEQAEKIKMPELRDRAYLDLVSYGLDHGNYDVAATALKKIEQVELRDTARNRIAVAYAKEGNAEDAFGILEEIEVEALRDVMRLQVIEAMIAPDELPEDMQ